MIEKLNDILQQAFKKMREPKKEWKHALFWAASQVNWVPKIFPYWDYYWDIITDIYGTKDLNWLTPYSVKGSCRRADIFSYVGLHCTKDWYIKRCIWSVNEKERAREVLIW